mmetsp:Transcript_9327/g.30790  ORF Transcript_9327/g.30790 Transcript_9327/m.30790 type:complete len:242 (-) Transcript_9327:74-799(-)
MPSTINLYEYVAGGSVRRSTKSPEPSSRSSLMRSCHAVSEPHTKTSEPPHSRRQRYVTVLATVTWLLTLPFSSTTCGCSRDVSQRSSTMYLKLYVPGSSVRMSAWSPLASHSSGMASIQLLNEPMMETLDPPHAARHRNRQSTATHPLHRGNDTVGASRVPSTSVFFWKSAASSSAEEPSATSSGSRACGSTPSAATATSSTSSRNPVATPSSSLGSSSSSGDPSSRSAVSADCATSAANG